ncbi:hypothetical protein N7470_009351 [Penicillium chermesinum]|nr:hypothetical protein N7470_009351 [Penicillium chermesinum]
MRFTGLLEISRILPAKLGNGPGRQHYSNTKLSNVLYTYALNRRFNKINRKSGKHWAVTAFDPGLMPGTGLARDATPLERFLWYWILPHIIPLLRMLFSENGASLARLAVGDDVKGVSGVYFEGRREIKSSQDSYVESKQEDLWIWTVNTIASDEEEKINFALEDLL